MTSEVIEAERSWAEVTQTILHGTIEGVGGNCFQAAIASVLNKPIEAVPHFVQFTQPTVATHCPCCGAFRPNCVCGGGQTYNPKTGEHRSWSCEPKDHGRVRYGFDQTAGASDRAEGTE